MGKRYYYGLAIGMLAAIVIGIAMSVLVDIAMDALLINWPGPVTMAFPTAICFICTGIAILLLSLRK